MRILYVVHSYPPFEVSGTPLIARQYARQARDAGLTVAVAFADPGRPLATEDDGIRRIPLPLAANWPVAAYTASLDTAPRLEALRAFRPDLIHILDWVNLPAGLLATARDLGVPVLRHVWNLEDFCPFNEPLLFDPAGRPCHLPVAAEQCGECLARRYGRVQLTLDGPIDQVIERLQAMRGQIRADFARAIAARAPAFAEHCRVYRRLIFPCVSFERSLAPLLDPKLPRGVVEHGIAGPAVPPAVPEPRQGPLRGLFLGPCTTRKGWGVVEQAFARLAELYPGRFSLTAYGATEPAGTLAPGLTLRPAFSPDRLDAVLAEADLGLVPSPFETFSRACREMLARGVPVVGSDAFGIPDIVRDGDNGLLIGEPTVEGLVAAVGRVLEQPELLERLRAGARATRVRTPAEEFAELLALYRETCPGAE
ncbi:MAG: hypothetical protein RLZZ501_2359 [Pseudomonadota bacterium]|jgi:glycosyltransferase involved in cell wall biosynthesis